MLSTHAGFRFVLPGDPFSHTQFERRVPIKTWGTDAYVASPEDTVLSKLLRNKTMASERQIEDVTKIIEARHDVLDFDYLRRWAPELDVEDLLNELIEETQWQEDR